MQPGRLLVAFVLLLLIGGAVTHAEHHCLHSAAHFQRRLYNGTHAAAGAMLSQEVLWRQTYAAKSARVDARPNNDTAQPRLMQLGDAAATLADRSFAPIRVRLDTTHLYLRESFCTAPGQLRPDFLGDKVACTAQDVFTDEMRDFLVTMVLPRVAYRVGRLLSVRRLRRALLVPEQVCGPDVHIPPSHTRDGVAGVDLLIYALAGPTATQPARVDNGSTSLRAVGNTVAWSGYCALDEDDGGRPVIARINFVPAQLRQRPASLLFAPRVADTSHTIAWSSDPATVALNEEAADWWTERYSRYVLHELCHTLGFAPLFLRRAAVARTAVVSGGRPVFTVVAPAVQRAARAFLGCPTLPGADLEAGGGEDTVGSHWRRVLFHDELMVGVPTPDAALSELTLAFFSSLGFYRVHDEYAETMRWGAQAGCNFAARTCRVAGEEGVVSTTANYSSSAAPAVPPMSGTDALDALRYWCTEPAIVTSHRSLQCTYDRRSVGICNVGYPNTTDGRPYGRSLLMEGCPVVEALPSMLCTEAFSALVSEGGGAGLGEMLYYGPQSRCVRTQGLRRLTSTDSSSTSAISTMQLPHANRTGSALSTTAPVTQSNVVPPALHMHGATCLRVRCLYGAQVQILIGGEWLSCPASGSAATLLLPVSSGYTGRVQCEPAALICTPTLYYAPASMSARARGGRDVPVRPNESAAASTARMSGVAPLRVFRITLGLQVVLLDAEDKSRVGHWARNGYDTLIMCHPAALREAVEQDIVALLRATMGGVAVPRATGGMGVDVVPPFVQAVLHLHEPDPRRSLIARMSRRHTVHGARRGGWVPFFAFSLALAIDAHDIAELHQRAELFVRGLRAGVSLPHVSWLYACEGTGHEDSQGSAAFLLPDLSACAHDAHLVRGVDARLLSDAEMYVEEAGAVDGGVPYAPELVAVADVRLHLRTVLLSQPSCRRGDGSHAGSIPISRTAAGKKMARSSDAAALADALRADVAHLLGLSTNLVTVRYVTWRGKPPPPPPGAAPTGIEDDGAMYWTAELTLAMSPVMVEHGAEPARMTWAGVTRATRAAWAARLRGGGSMPRVSAAMQYTLSGEAPVTVAGCGNSSAREGTMLLGATVSTAQPQMMPNDDNSNSHTHVSSLWQSLRRQCIVITSRNRCVTATFGLISLFMATAGSAVLFVLCLYCERTK